ncbi:hypothetical protein, partial [Bordetella pertussis]|uniref:hypothetical protein n=4 Tax=Bordetella pertussis TaxID=520 RepID=UPI003B9862B0
LQLASTPPRHRARCTHLQTQPGRIQPIDSSQLPGAWQYQKEFNGRGLHADRRACGVRKTVPRLTEPNLGARIFLRAAKRKQPARIVV